MTKPINGEVIVTPTICNIVYSAELFALGYLGYIVRGVEVGLNFYPSRGKMGDLRGKRGYE
jgi:hypothetical protein